MFDTSSYPSDQQLNPAFDVNAFYRSFGLTPPGAGAYGGGGGGGGGASFNDRFGAMPSAGASFNDRFGAGGASFNDRFGGMQLPYQGGTLTPQDLAIPHAYPPEVRYGWSDVDDQGNRHYTGQ